MTAVRKQNNINILIGLTELNTQKKKQITFKTNQIEGYIDRLTGRLPDRQSDISTDQQKIKNKNIY